MSINSELKNLRFLINSGISSFIQNTPNNRYQLKTKIEDTKKNIQSLNLDDINNLNDLKLFTLKNTNHKSLIFSDGNPHSKIMLIGGFLSSEEARIGKIFSGSSGILLDKMLNSINLDRKVVYLTNIVPSFLNNNQELNTKEILEYLPIIQKHIELIEPSIIVLFGKIAAKTILTTNINIEELRGKWHKYNSLKLKKEITVRVTYHPNDLLKNLEYKKKAWIDLKEIQKIL